MNPERMKVYNTMEVLINYWQDSLNFWRICGNEKQYRQCEANIEECMEVRYTMIMEG